MTKAELLEWYKSIQLAEMPEYIEASDANWQQLLINGNWENEPYSWTLLFNGGKWKYAETDFDRGYVIDLKIFDTELDATDYAKDSLNKTYLATFGNAKEDMLCRYIQQKYEYSEKRARTMISRMVTHPDVFEEFFNYARIGKFCKEDKSQTEVCGYTAERLVREHGLSPLGAYNYLVYLIEEPEQALKDLNAELPKK